MERILNIIRETKHREATDLLAFVLGKPREWILAHHDATVRPARVARFRALRNRLRRGEPLAQIIGEQWFYGRPFSVTRDVLIPRPESETIIEVTLDRIRNQKSGIMGNLMIIDVGTGSGCLAVTLAAELPRAHVIAMDISPATLRVARKNAKRNGVSNRIHFLHNNLLQPYYTQKYDRIFRCSFNIGTPIFIIANPPYLTTAEWRTLPKSLKLYEPRVAFDGGRDGLKPFHELFEQLAELAACGLRLTAFLEIDPRRKVALASIVRTMLPGWHARWHRDIARRWRVLEIAKNT